MTAYRRKLLPGLIIFILAGLLAGCASPGQKFIDLGIAPQPADHLNDLVGVAPFSDARKDAGAGYIGYRRLLDDSQETYFVTGLDLADTLSRAVIQYLHNNGMNTRQIEFAATPAGVRAAPDAFSYLISGRINSFECTARKKAGRTDVTLDIDLTLMLGHKSTHKVQSIPVVLKSERMAFTFDTQKAEEIMNKALAEVLDKALPFDDPQQP